MALLADYAGNRWLPVQVTEEDKETAASAEALTLLQLLQGIDLAGTTFPPEALNMQADDDDDLLLRRVCVLAADQFELGVVAPAQRAEVRPVACSSAFSALALSLRYSCPLEVDAALLDELSVPEEEGEQAFPKCFTRADASAQRAAITRRMAGIESAGPPEPLTSEPLDIPSFDPATLAPPNANMASPPPSDLNANRPPPGILAKALAIAREKGDKAAIEKIEKAIKDAE